MLKRIFRGLLIELLAALSLLYVGDWTVWRIRVAKGGGMGTVSIGTMIVTPLKGQKEEYDWGGTMDVSCTRSIFPHAGNDACWWLQTHRIRYEN